MFSIFLLLFLKLERRRLREAAFPLTFSSAPRFDPQHGVKSLKRCATILLLWWRLPCTSKLCQTWYSMFHFKTNKKSIKIKVPTKVPSCYYLVNSSKVPPNPFPPRFLCLVCSSCTHKGMKRTTWVSRRVCQTPLGFKCHILF